MQIVESPAFREEILKAMAAREFKERLGVHCTDLIYCLNKQAWRRLTGAMPTDQELLLYSLGWATQRWITGTFVPEKEYVVDGITVTPDSSTVDGVKPWELKTTYASSTHSIETMLHWLRQLMAQCKVTGATEAYLSRLELMGDWGWVYGTKEKKKTAQHPTLSAYLIIFTPEEIVVNWAWLLMRKARFEKILTTGQMLPKQLALAPGQEWECGYCPRKDSCDAE